MVIIKIKLCLEFYIQCIIIQSHPFYPHRQQQNELIEHELTQSYGYDPNTNQNERQRTRWKSITLAPSGMDYAAEFDDEYKSINMDIYDTRIKDKLLTYDFSINTSITEFFEESSSSNNIAIWFWEYIIENGITECNAINDITMNRILRVPQPNKDKYILELYGITLHFW